MSRSVTITYQGKTHVYADPKEAIKILITYAESTEDESDMYTINEALRALSVDKVFSALWDFDQHLRSVHKYGEMPLDQDTGKTLWEEHERYLDEYKDFELDRNNHENGITERTFVAGIHDMAFYSRQKLHNLLRENGVDPDEVYN